MLDLEIWFFDNTEKCKKDFFYNRNIKLFVISFHIPWVSYAYTQTFQYVSTHLKAHWDTHLDFKNHI